MFIFYRYIIFVFAMGITLNSLAQIDTSVNYWDRVLYEVYTTKQDSFKSHEYYKKKEPFFECYFNQFSQGELDSLRIKCLGITQTTIGDSLKYPQYLAKVEYCWNVSRMLFGIELKKSINQLNEYYDSFGDTIQLEFIKNGNLIFLNDNFKIYYVLNTDNKKRIEEAKIFKNTFIPPDIGTDTVGKIILEYDNHFYDITLCEHRLQGLKKEIKLTIFFETKPYTKVIDRYDLKSIRDELDKRKDMRGIFYVSTERLRICKYDYFKRESEFFQRGKKIMKGRR